MRTLALAALLVLPVFAEDPVTDQECAEYGEKLRKAVIGNKGKTFDRMVDMDRIVDRAVEGEAGTPEMKGQFRAGIKSSDFGASVVSQFAGGGSYTFLRVRRKGAATSLLFRAINNEGGVNYHEIFVEKHDGRVVGVDLYVFLTGESLSDTFRREWLKVAAIEAAGGNLVGWQKDYIDNLDKITRIVDDVTKNPRQAVTDIATLPETLRNDRFIMMQRFLAGSSLGGKDYEEALDAWAKAFPGDPSLDLLLVDGHTLKGEFEKVVEALKRLDGTVGGDPYLTYMQSEAWLQGKKLAEARKAAEAAVAGDRTLIQPMWVLVAVSLQEQKFPEVTQLLLKIEGEYGIPMGDLGGVEAFAEYVESEEYEKWVEARKKLKGPEEEEGEDE
jgi:hypothetical protein